MRFVNPNPNPNSNEYRSNLNRRTSNVPYGKFTVLLCLEKGEGTRIEKCTTAGGCMLQQPSLQQPPGTA